MLPALTNAQELMKPAQRLFVGYVPNGVIMDKWTPKSFGVNFELPVTLQPLAKHKEKISVLTGLALHPAMPQPGEGTGDHVRASAAYLTGAHPKKTEGADIQCGVSMDQLAAAHIGNTTQMRSLEIALDPNELIGACEAGWSCAYANTLSWRNESTPLPMENQPRAVFERLFGDSDDTSKEAREIRLAEERSILDSLLTEVDKLQKTLPDDDRQKINQYLEAIRDAERRIAIAEKQNIVDYFIQAGTITLTLNIIMMVLAFYIAQLLGTGNAQKKCISIECGLQNGTLAIFIATTLFGGGIYLIPASTYSLIMFATSLIFVFLKYYLNQPREHSLFLN